MFKKIFELFCICLTLKLFYLYEKIANLAQKMQKEAIKILLKTR